MTRVSVHFNAADPLQHACRVIRKGVRLGASVTVLADGPTLDRLDALLWTFDPHSFVAHLRAPTRAGAGDPRAPWTPVWLVEHADASPSHDVLLNLGEQPPAGFERYDRLIDIVAIDLPAREAGRLRWRHYASRGYEIQREEAPQ